MGINLVVACHRCEVQATSMRGEESDDLRWWFEHHRECFEVGRVLMYRDCDHTPDFVEAWIYEKRPFILKLFKLHPELKSGADS